MENYSTEQQFSSKGIDTKPDIQQSEAMLDSNFTPIDSFLNTLDAKEQAEVRSMVNAENSKDALTNQGINTLANMGQLMSVAQEIIQEDDNEQIIPVKKENFFQRLAKFFRSLFKR